MAWRTCGSLFSSIRAGQGELQAQGGRKKAAHFNSSVYCWIRHQDTSWESRQKKLKRKTFRVNRISPQGNIWSQEILVLNVSVLTFITFLVTLQQYLQWGSSIQYIVQIQEDFLWYSQPKPNIFLNMQIPVYESAVFIYLYMHHYRLIVEVLQKIWISKKRRK